MIDSIVLGVMLAFLSFDSNEFGSGKGEEYLDDQGALITENLPVVPQKAFYKDLFLDAGVGLTSRKFLYGARYLGLSTEGISFSRSNATQDEIALQNSIVEGDENDTNGRLLYPDGQPRYRLLFVNGGSATTHGKSLNSNSLQNIKQFIQNGGSYVGTCAGGFFASNGYDGNPDYPYYLSVWPSIVNRTGIANDTTGMTFAYDSPLLMYYDFGGDYYVSNVRHNKGGYPAELPDGTEVLARYDYPLKSDVHMQPCIWAYKADSKSGRLVLEGSHPEEVSSGERRDLTAAMMLYAMDGVGQTTIKGLLHNGEVRMMDKTTEDNDPLFTKIGDLQCHHFAVVIPENAYDISVNVKSNTDCDFLLAICHDTYAYPDNADNVSSYKGAEQTLSFNKLEAGLWYITVQCLTTVETIETDYGQSYLDRVGVLNGIPYKIMVNWKTADVNNVMELIDSIGLVEYTADCKLRIISARTAYEALTDVQKALVTNYGVLTDAETTFAALKSAAEQAVADQSAANAVISLIDAIGYVEYAADCESRICVARAAYDALTEAQKALVTNYGVLTDAETTFSALKFAAEQAAVDKAASESVIQLIAAIGTVEYSEECKSKINAARAAYDALTEAQKSLVSNYTILTDAESEYERLREVAASINTIKSPFKTDLLYDLNGRSLQSRKGINGVNLIQQDGKVVKVLFKERTSD